MAGKLARILTRNAISDSPSVLIRLYLDFGAHEWIMQPKDSHMFKLNESPTNIIFFPLHFSKKNSPLNLQNDRIEGQSQPTKVQEEKSWESVPWEVTWKGLPPIFEVQVIRPLVLETVEFWIYEGTRCIIIERIWSIIYPFAPKNVTTCSGKFARSNWTSTIIGCIQEILKFMISFCCLAWKKKE